MIYTGIGSRETPNHILDIMTTISKLLDNHGFVLRSGGADGADTAFATGSTNQDIYVPWKNFNKVKNGIFTGNVEEGMQLASKLHPAWERCSLGAKKLHSRNTFQILGPDPISNPIKTKFVVCYTKNAEIIGGTATAIKLALQNDIPIFNLGMYDNFQDFVGEFQSLEECVMKDFELFLNENSIYFS
ncbi:MAG: hypothetical protein KDH96_01545 [Candidatus Riesia sp.]|nr:hypothetical protein [Candidatus Riesia sp.]